MKKIFLLISLFVLIDLACGLSITGTSPTSPAPLPTNTALPVIVDPTQIPASPTPIPVTLTPIATQTASSGVDAAFWPVSLVLPAGLASGVHGSQIPRVDGKDLAYWDLTPGHTLLDLEGYRLQGKTHPPQIYVYPALAYAEMLPGAFESIHRLDNILYGPGGPSLNADQLPTVPFFNARQAFASKAELISFQNGGGVRFLTEYAQYAVSANNQDLFYHFEGVSRDGAYYIVAILPISHPKLAETSDAGATLPVEGIPYPYFVDPEADMQGYYTDVTALLNAASPDEFTPTIAQLDALIQSIRITQ